MNRHIDDLPHEPQTCPECGAHPWRAHASDCARQQAREARKKRDA